MDREKTTIKYEVYTMKKSMVRQLIEALEDVNLPKEPTSAAPVEGQDMSSNDFAPAPEPPAPGASETGIAPAMPTVPPTAKNNTVQKDVLNKEVIKSITGPLKNLVTSFEKIFESDLTTEQAKPHITQFLEVVAVLANNLAKLGGLEVEEAGGMEEAPPMEDLNPMPEEPNPMPEPPMPEGGMGEEEFQGAPEPEYTNPFGSAPESDFTQPEEAI